MSDHISISLHVPIGEAAQVAKVQAWLREHDAGELVECGGDQSGGDKHPCVSVWCAGYKSLAWRELIDFVLALEWRTWECVVLIVVPYWPLPAIVSQPMRAEPSPRCS